MKIPSIRSGRKNHYKPALILLQYEIILEVFYAAITKKNTILFDLNRNDYVSWLKKKKEHPIKFIILVHH